MHWAQWTLASQRLDRLPGPRGRDAGGGRAGAGVPGAPVIGGATARAAGTARSGLRLDAVSGDTAVVLISGDGHHAWLNTTAPMHLALPVRDSVVREGEWFAAYGRLSTLVGNDGTSRPRRTAAPRARGRAWASSGSSTSSSVAAPTRPSAGPRRRPLRIRMATYADTLEDVIAAGLRTGDPLPGCDNRQ